MIIIGVTGNSGAGKTTISTIIKNNSKALVIDADLLAKSLLKPGTEYYDKTIELFGKKILMPKPSKNKGKIDKAAFSKILFSDDKKREKMNALTFKYVGQEIKKIILENKDREIIVIDAPLLYEGGFEKICNYVIAVVAEEKTKIKRIMQRDKIHPNQASQRISTQKNEDFYKEHANFIIENNENTRYITLVKETLKIVHTIKDEANKAE